MTGIRAFAASLISWIAMRRVPWTSCVGSWFTSHLLRSSWITRNCQTPHYSRSPWRAPKRKKKKSATTNKDRGMHSSTRKGKLNFTLNREACMLPPTRLFQVRRILPTKMTKPRSKPRKQHDSCFAIVHEAESRGNGVSQFSNTTELVNAQALLVVQSRMDKLLLHTKWLNSLKRYTIQKAQKWEINYPSNGRNSEDKRK